MDLAIPDAEVHTKVALGLPGTDVAEVPGTLPRCLCHAAALGAGSQPADVVGVG